MPRNGSGQYSAPSNSWNPAINGVPATAADWQAVLNDIVSALTQSVSRDGQTSMTGNLPMGSTKLTGLGAGTAAGDSLRFEQLFSQGQQQDIASAATMDIGTPLTTLLNVTGATTITSFGTNYNGPRFLRFAGACTLTHSASLVLPGGANITTAAGDSLIAVPLGSPATGWRVAAYQLGAVVPGSIPDESVTFAKLQNIATARLLGRATAGTGDVEELTGAQATGLLSAATDAARGVVELATLAEAQAGTDTERAITPATLRAAQINLGTAVASTSGTAIDFTGIPAGVRRVTVMFSGVSTNGTSNHLVQIGAGSVDSTGYVSTGSLIDSGSSISTSTAGMVVRSFSASNAVSLTMVFTNISGNNWVAFHTGTTGIGGTLTGGGSKSLSGALDRLRITTVGGTDTFDDGTINISWEF